MVSGKSSKAVRNARAAVVTQRSVPWGTIAAVLVVALFAAGILGYYFAVRGDREEQIAALAPFTATADNQDPSRTIPGVVVQNYQGGTHIGPTEQVAYTTTPGIGGQHDGVWAACSGTVYPKPVRTENLVHSMEHGALWIAYNPDQITGDALATLSAKVDNKPYLAMSPYPGLDQPIALQSWGHQLKVSDVNDVRIDQFIQALRRNQYTSPEAGASCSAGQGFSENDPPPFAPAPAPGTPGAQPEVSAAAPAAPGGG